MHFFSKVSIKYYWGDNGSQLSRKDQLKDTAFLLKPTFLEGFKVAATRLRAGDKGQAQTQ